MLDDLDHVHRFRVSKKRRKERRLRRERERVEDRDWEDRRTQKWRINRNNWTYTACLSNTFVARRNLRISKSLIIVNSSKNSSWKLKIYLVEKPFIDIWRSTSMIIIKVDLTSSKRSKVEPDRNFFLSPVFFSFFFTLFLALIGRDNREKDGSMTSGRSTNLVNQTGYSPISA